MKLSQASQRWEELLVPPASKEATYVICAPLTAEVNCDMWNILVTAEGSGWDPEEREANGRLLFGMGIRMQSLETSASHLTHLRLPREWKTGLVGTGISAPGAIPRE